MTVNTVIAEQIGREYMCVYKYICMDVCMQENSGKHSDVQQQFDPLLFMELVGSAALNWLQLESRAKIWSRDFERPAAKTEWRIKGCCSPLCPLPSQLSPASARIRAARWRRHYVLRRLYCKVRGQFSFSVPLPLLNVRLSPKAAEIFVNSQTMISHRVNQSMRGWRFACELITPVD